MEVIAAGAAWVLQQTSPQKLLRKLGLVSLVVNTTIHWPDLAEQLSAQASISIPGKPDFAESISRWREWHSPNIVAVVKVFTERDVQETIRYSNENGLPFVARSGGHGATEALGLAQNAILIDLRGLDSIDLSKNGGSAKLGGGARVKQVVDRLWASKKQTVTGICECVGISAPILGGGHGWLQGKYGLAADQVISARLALPNGDVVEVSETMNPDLFWALKGAGHNFGIVTEWEYKIYDVENENWAYGIFLFSGKKLEALVELTNRMMKTQPSGVTHWIYFVNIPQIDPDHPIIWYAVIQDGPLTTLREYIKEIHEVGPVNVDVGEVPMPQLASLTFMGENTAGCAKGSTGLRFPIGLKVYDQSAVREVYDQIDDTIRHVPEFAGSFFMLEGYSSQGVRIFDSSSTAFPHRSDNILVTSYIMYQPNATLDPIAQEFGESLRQKLLSASDDPRHLRAYVNYAHGNEALEAIYGWEEWRLTRLKKLKVKWDPHNRMRFYNPIV